MIQIEQLIGELCPRGFEYVALNEIAFTFPGLSGKTKTDFTNGNARFASYKNIFANPSLDLLARDFVNVAHNEKQNSIRLGDVLFTGSSESLEELGMSSAVTTNPTEPIYLNSFCFGLRFNEPGRFDPRFVKHLFRSSTIRNQIRASGSGVTRINISKHRFLKVQVPIVPLQIQSKIVEVLDTFVELEAELEAELETRRKQYLFYRDALLSFPKESGVRWLPMGEVVKIRNGRDYKNFATGEVPVYGSGGIMTYVDTFTYDKPSVLIPRKGSLSNVFFVDRPFWTVDTIFYTEIDEKLLVPRYFYHLILSLKLEELNQAGGVPSLTQGVLNKILLPIPSIDEQLRIANVLDGMNELAEGLDIGLPAELSARRKQYDYYRDKLLTFKELAA